MRDVFVAAVMDDVPKTDYETAIRDAAQKAALAAMPPAVKKLYAAEETKPWVRTEYIHLNDRNGLPEGQYMSFTALPCMSESELVNAIETATEGLCKAWCAQSEKHDTLRNTLRVAANRCATTTQLAEALPEFAKYLPQSEAEATRNLPAIANLVTEFTRAGWPKGKKAA